MKNDCSPETESRGAAAQGELTMRQRIAIQSNSMTEDLDTVVTENPLVSNLFRPFTAMSTLLP